MFLLNTLAGWKAQVVLIFQLMVQLQLQNLKWKYPADQILMVKLKRMS